MNSVRKPVALQERVLELLKEDGPLSERDIGRYLPDVDRMALDVCLGALQRANKIVPSFGKFDVGPALREGAVKANTKARPDTPRPPAPAPQVPQREDAPPTAEEEARSALRPPPRDPVKPRPPRAPASENQSRAAVSDGAVTPDPEKTAAPCTADAPGSKVRPSLRELIDRRRADLQERIEGLESELAAAREEVAGLDQLLALAEKHGVAG